MTIGRAVWERISAVEGVHLSKEAKQMAEESDRLGLPADERRSRIIAKYFGRGRSK